MFDVMFAAVIIIEIEVPVSFCDWIGEESSDALRFVLLNVQDRRVLLLILFRKVCR